MSPHETLVSETRAWLGRARADLGACDALIAAGLTAEALFHAQQCAEKAMKAVLTWHQVAFKKPHDLDELKLVCLPFAGDATAHLAGIERLSQYAWRFRYPGHHTPPSKQRRRKPGTRPGSFWALWPLSSNPSSVVDRAMAITNSKRAGKAPAFMPPLGMFAVGFIMDTAERARGEAP
jgi:HEPN domain-containing protein